MVLVVTALASTGYIVYQRHKLIGKNSAATGQSQTTTEPSDTPTTQPAQTTAVVAEDLSKTYTDPTGLVGIMYPSDWQVKTQNSAIDKDHPIVTSTITSPSGTVLNLNLDWGGRGGACFANANDKPFQPGNECSSVETLAQEPTKISNVYDYVGHVAPNGAYSQTFEKSNIVLAVKHYADRDGKAQYIVGLGMANSDTTVELNKPIMGAIYPDYWFDVWDAKAKSHGEIHAYASFPQESLLDTQDGKTVKSMLQSLTVNLPS